MIALLTGTLLQKSPTHLTIDVHGVGYQVLIALSTFYRIPDLQERVTLHVHTHVREDTLQLYGFLTLRDKGLFLLLMGVSGVGPKLALGILSGMETEVLIETIRRGEVTRLKSIPGVGPKMAGRLVLELAEKIATFGEEGPRSTASGKRDPMVEDALSALVNLGYPQAEAKRALDSIPVPVSGVGDPEVPGDRPSLSDLIKEALKRLARVP